MKTVLITGAGRGIGLALTREFAQNGYRVVGTYRTESAAKELLDLSASSKSIVPVKADVTNEKTFAALKEELSLIKSIDILINNSGVVGDRGDSLAELDLDRTKDVFEVNTFGPVRICQLVLPYMKLDGTIAQITSKMGSIKDNSSGGYYDYRMSKVALNMFNMCLAKEFPQLTCLVLHPGWVQTEMGGAGATVPVRDCSLGLYKVITGAKSAQSGGFFNYTGEALPW